MEQFERKRKKWGQRNNKCSKCDQPVEESRNGQRYCKGCHAANMRAKRPKNSELKPEAKKRANCRSYANCYLNRGSIEKKPCEVCGDTNSQMHHEDYNKPLQVRWFCRKHHMELHHTIKT